MSILIQDFAKLYYNITFIYLSAYLAMQGIALWKVSLVLLIVKIWDAVNDPIFGYIFDKVQFKSGQKSLPWLRIAVALIPVVTIILFSIPSGMSELGKLIWFGVAYVLWDTVYTLTDVPAYAMLNTMTDNLQERAELLSINRIYSGLGQGLYGVLLTVLGLYHWRVLPTGGAEAVKHGTMGETMRETWGVIVQFFQKKYIWIYIAWIVFYRFTEGLVIKIVPLFLKADTAVQGLGLTKDEIGLYYGTFGVVAFIVGSILGGYFISWRGLKKAIFPLCCIFNIPFVVYALLALYQPESAFLVCGAIVFEYFSYGFGFVGLTLFIMQQVAPGKHQMAHYAFGSALANLGVMLPGMISGVISDAIGYEKFFLWALVSAIPAFVLTWVLPFTYPDPQEQK